MAGTDHILKKLVESNACKNGEEFSAQPIDNLDELTPNPELNLSHQPKQVKKHELNMSHALSEILANTNTPSPDLPD
ncbi:hypothetical protein [Legionella sp. W05-934-2]|jgi:hypothetical protein|uniref:hypothetical protein n=1 Tax=Legionella sp. W05-934-2 TaxID=1198649 RepID=UPI003461939D